MTDTSRRPLEPAGAAVEHDVVAVRVPATRANVAEVRHLLVAFARLHGATDRTAAKVGLAVSEAMTNAVLHGYALDPAQHVDVVADHAEDAVEIVIVDAGRGLAADVRSEGLGLGLGLIARSAARFTIRDREPGTEVWMRFELP